MKYKHHLKISDELESLAWELNVEEYADLDMSRYFFSLAVEILAKWQKRIMKEHERESRRAHEAKRAAPQG